MHLMAVILALLLAGKVIVVAAATRVDKLVAETLLLIVVPASDVFVAVAGIQGSGALGRFVFNSWLLYILSAWIAPRRAILFRLKAIVVAVTAAIIEHLALPGSCVVVPHEHILVTTAHISWLIALAFGRSLLRLRLGFGLGLGLGLLWRLRSSTALQTIRFGLETIAIAFTAAIIELATSTTWFVKHPLNRIVITVSTFLRLITDIHVALGWRWSRRLWLLLAASQAGLFAWEAILITFTAAIVELATGSLLCIVVPGKFIVRTLTDLSGNVADILD